MRISIAQWRFPRGSYRKMSGPYATAVVVTYNSCAVIAQTLEEAARSHRGGELDVIVVDNASLDGTATVVREQFPWVRVIESGSNLGFGRGCNLGVQEVTTPYVLLLNPDAVLPKESLKILIAFMDSHPAAAIAAPATWTYGTELQAAGGLPHPWQIILAAAGLRSHSKRRREILPSSPPFRTDWLGGGIMLIRSKDFRKLGGFDPRFFLYFEETDLCRRALSAGLELWAVGEATAHHLGGTAAKSSGQRLTYGASIADHYFRSRFYYLVKHFGWSAAVLTEATEVLLLSAKSFAKRIIGRGGQDLANRLAGPVMRLPVPVEEPAQHQRPGE
jgi:N-acetylglucosaminyl-diphospho-decaprenol L-rhamnosyltransferase